MTVWSWSATSVKGKWYFSLKACCAGTSSVLTPMTVTPLSERSWKLSRRLQPSAVQPGVSALGKK